MESYARSQAQDLLRCAQGDLERAADVIRLASTGAPYQLVNQARVLIEGAEALVDALDAE